MRGAVGAEISAGGSSSSVLILAPNGKGRCTCSTISPRHGDRQGTVVTNGQYPGYGYRSSNSPFFTPVMNAVISARVYISAGPEGCRELRTAIAPSGSSATSTQLPLGLLTALLRQAAETSWSAWMPLLNCIVLLASHFVGMGPRAAVSMVRVSTVCAGQPNRAKCKCI